MTRLIAVVSLSGLLGASPFALAAPPSDARPLSQIIKVLEDSGNVAYFDEIEWDNDGYWEIEYRRPDGSSVKVKIDPVSGQPRK
jgi:hypothetical protein